MRKILPFVFISLLCLPVISDAHPHVKLTSRVHFVFNGTQCEGCRIEWEFDDFFSSSVIREFDKDKDGSFNKKEINDIFKGAFTNLKNYGYFVFLRKGSDRRNPGKVAEFTAWQKDGVLFYSFFIPLDKTKYDNDFYVAIFDRSFYCSVFYGDNPVTIQQKSGKAPVYEVSQNKKYPVYYNPLGAADDLTIYKKWKPGLETAYPDEIHIHFEQ